MYEYIKGKKVDLDEHMLSASEIAFVYGLSTVEGKQPHGLMISAILREYISSNNLNVAEYYYAHSRGCMRVYPEILWKAAMKKFMYDNDLDTNQSTEKRVYKMDSEKKKFMYVHNKAHVNQSDNHVIDFTERRKRNGN